MIHLLKVGDYDSISATTFEDVSDFDKEVEIAINENGNQSCVFLDAKKLHEFIGVLLHVQSKIRNK